MNQPESCGALMRTSFKNEHTTSARGGIMQNRPVFDTLEKSYAFRGLGKDDPMASRNLRIIKQINNY